MFHLVKAHRGQGAESPVEIERGHMTLCLGTWQ